MNQIFGHLKFQSFQTATFRRRQIRGKVQLVEFLQRPGDLLESFFEFEESRGGSR